MWHKLTYNGKKLQTIKNWLAKTLKSQQYAACTSICAITTEDKQLMQDYDKVKQPLIKFKYHSKPYKTVVIKFLIVLDSILVVLWLQVKSSMKWSFMHKEELVGLATAKTVAPKVIAQQPWPKANTWVFVKLAVESCQHPGSIQINLKCLANQVTRQITSIHQPIITHCAAGKRSTQAAQLLIELGYENIFIVEGGIEAWIPNKLPTSSALII